MKFLIMASVIGGNALLFWAGLHFGGRWIDKMLCVPPPIDPNKPIVLPHRMGK